jgi:hypothetical protein
MPRVKQQKIKRKHRDKSKPPVDLLTPEQKVSKRREQAEALKQQLAEKVGLPIFKEIKEFILALETWVITGEETEGTCWIPAILRDLEWKFHPIVERYPEIWLRIPKEFDEDI